MLPSASKYCGIPKDLLGMREARAHGKKFAPSNDWRHHKTIVWNVVEGKFPGLHVQQWRCFRYPFRTCVSSGGRRRNVSERSKLWLPATKSRMPWARTVELPRPSTDGAPMVEAASLRPLALPAQAQETGVAHPHVRFLARQDGLARIAAAGARRTHGHLPRTRSSRPWQPP